jgi:hypothetical protein
LVHLDAFAGNMLTVSGKVSAVIDIGMSSLVGDRRLDPVSVAVYLSSPEITPTAREEDLASAMAWLRGEGWEGLFDPVRRWLAAYWSEAVDDPSTLAWCRRVLLAEG